MPAPFGVYEVNRTSPLSESLAAIGTGEGTVFTAITVGLLYLAGYGLIYRIVRRSFAGKRVISRNGLRTAMIVVGVFIGLAIISGGVAVLVPLLLVGDAISYLDFVVTSSVALLVAIALGLASVLVSAVFGKTVERDRVTGSVTLVVSVFWLGPAFLALYHVLWVVYILLLTTLWPLKVVTPK